MEEDPICRGQGSRARLRSTRGSFAHHADLEFFPSSGRCAVSFAGLVRQRPRGSSLRTKGSGSVS